MKKKPPQNKTKKSRSQRDRGSSISPKAKSGEKKPKKQTAPFSIKKKIYFWAGINLVIAAALVLLVILPYQEKIINLKTQIQENRQAITEAQEKREALILSGRSYQILEDSGNLPKAVQNYKKAIQINQDQNLLATDMQLHLELCELKNGDKATLEKINKLLKILISENKTNNNFHKNVLISGMYLKLAKYFEKKDLTKAQEYLQLAKELINQDERLKIRKKQLENLNID